MFALLHLIFEFFRISLLSCIYGFLLNNFLKYKKIKLPVIIGFLFFSLFFWRFSYWRNNGFGDEGRVPLTSNYQVRMIDFEYGEIYFNNSPIKTVDKLYYDKNNIYSLNNNKYSIINTFNHSIKKNLSENEFKSLNGKISNLQNLSDFHSDYFGWFKLLFL